MNVRGKVKNGEIVLPPGTQLPEGATVKIETLELTSQEDPLAAAVEKLARPRPHLPRDYASNFALFFGSSSDNRNSPLGMVGTIALVFLAPIAAGLVQMAISRSREYDADRVGAEIAGQPLWLASALERIQSSASQVVNADAERNPATAHMFIINPLAGHGMDNLFSTHPSTQNRISKLQSMAQGMYGAAQEAPRRGPWG